jgi:PAS domain S-box-containing protein
MGEYPFLIPRLWIYLVIREEFASVTETQIIHPDDLGIIRERYQQRIQGKDVPSSYEIRIVCKDGSIKWVMVNVVLFSWEGKPATLS